MDDEADIIHVVSNGAIPVRLQLWPQKADLRHRRVRRPIESRKQCVSDLEKLRVVQRVKTKKGSIVFAPLDAGPDAVAAPFLAA
ncbi:hypothetical protein [Bradyrhizobium commune]|uniref:Uncharacterized protein n=1 Tax=Bradyrhizobium commune TaxID=83627 RepID=A0A7S9GY80_9BRAD|nr:hypothetical protein [Bradyrhizobium commune]QPF90223.1 hypothetical protein IC761_27490 [Bradyrhizobium commune]